MSESHNRSLESSGTVAKCGDHPQSSSEDCDQTTGWGRDRDHGPCRHHDDHYSPNGTGENGAASSIEEACAVLAEAVRRTDAEDKLDDGVSDTVGVGRAVIRGAFPRGERKPAYSAIFDSCAVEDCDRGCETFEATTCDKHDEPSDDGSSDDSQDVALDDLSDEEVAALKQEILDSL